MMIRKHKKTGMVTKQKRKKRKFSSYKPMVFSIEIHMYYKNTKVQV